MYYGFVMSRKIVMDTGALHMLGDDRKALDFLKEGGFEYFDISLFWKGGTEHIGVGDDCYDNAKALRAYADSIGLKCVQSHAYFTNGIDEETLKRRFEYICKDMKIASIMGAEHIVIHPIGDYDFDQNLEFIRSFIPLAHELNIKICVENTWTWRDGVLCPVCTSTADSFKRFIDEINDPYVGACLDIGHAEMNRKLVSAVEMIKTLGKRIYALHIHDNEGKDDHQVPYTHCIDFSSILKALKEVDYQGNITFEVETCYSHGWDHSLDVPFELYPAFIRLERSIGQYFADYLDK